MRPPDGHADPEGWQGPVEQGPQGWVEAGQRVGVAELGTADPVEGGGGVAHRPREHAVHAEPAAVLAGEWPHRHPSPARLEPDEAAARRRDAQRATAVVAVGDGDDAGGDGGGGPARRPAGRAVERPGVAGRAVRDRLGRDGGPELGGVGASEADQPERPQAGGEVGVLRGPPVEVAEEGGALVVGLAGLVGAEVLQQGRHALERTGGEIGVDGLVTGGVVAGVDDGAEHGVPPLHPGDAGLDELGRGDLPARHEPAQLHPVAPLRRAFVAAPVAPLRRAFVAAPVAPLRRAFVAAPVAPLRRAFLAHVLMPPSWPGPCRPTAPPPRPGRRGGAGGPRLAAGPPAAPRRGARPLSRAGAGRRPAGRSR